MRGAEEGGRPCDARCRPAGALPSAAQQRHAEAGVAGQCPPLGPLTAGSAPAPLLSPAPPPALMPVPPPPLLLPLAPQPQPLRAWWVEWVGGCLRERAVHVQARHPLSLAAGSGGCADDALQLPVAGACCPGTLTGGLTRVLDPNGRPLLGCWCPEPRGFDELRQRPLPSMSLEYHVSCGVQGSLCDFLLGFRDAMGSCGNVRSGRR